MANVGKVWNGTAWVDLGSTATFQSAGTATVGVVQLTDSTSSTSTTTAATPNSVKSAYDLAGTAIPKNTVTAAGDILYASGSATVTRLGIGTANQVLSVSGTVPAWTTPSAGGMTCIGTATPSGATSLAFTSISPNYKHLMVIWRDVYQNTDNTTWSIRLNNDTNSNYDFGVLVKSGLTTAAAGNFAMSQTQITGNSRTASPISYGPGSATATGDTYSSGIFTVYRYAELETRIFEWKGFGYDATNGYALYNVGSGRYRESGTAITSIDFIRSGTQTITGTFYLYGVS